MVDGRPAEANVALDKGAPATGSNNEKLLADIGSITAASSERLNAGAWHPASPDKDVSGAANKAGESAKTLAGKAIGMTWDLVSGRADTAAGRAERAAKADSYAEIAADTVASVPRFSALTGGVARSLLLFDVSGQRSTADLARNTALNFFEGGALNKVGKMASTESAVGRIVSGRLGSGIGAEIVTHSISGGGFGLVKSSMSAQTWHDREGNIAVTGGLKNLAVSTGTGALIGVPAGMAGLRVGKVVTSSLAGQAEQSVVAAAVQKFATGAGSGFASGAVFGGVEQASQGKSLGEIADGTWHGGLIGLLTGGFSADFSHRSAVLRNDVASSREVVPQPSELSAGLRDIGFAHEQTSARDYRKNVNLSELYEKSDALTNREAQAAAHARLEYKLEGQADLREIGRRMTNVRYENRSFSGLKEDAPKTAAEIQAAIKAHQGREPLDFSKHFWEPFVEFKEHASRIYEVAGQSARIVVPEDYARSLDQVRDLRLANSRPTVYDRLTREEKAEVTRIMMSGDANGLAKFMTPSEMSDYMAVYQAGQLLKAHPHAFRALPEDLVPILDALPDRSLIKEIVLHNGRSTGDHYRAVDYNAPDFQAAATVGTDGRVDFFEASVGTRLPNTTFHEWAHLAKWKSPAYSKMFDLATVVDRQDFNTDHQATADIRKVDPAHEPIRKIGVFYPDLHSTRSQDENWAVSMGEEILSPDPDAIFSYSWNAPVRTMALADNLEAMVAHAGRENKSVLSSNFLERADYLSDAARPFAFKAIQDRLSDGTPAERAAAAQMMVHFGGRDQAVELLDHALNPDNRLVPEWRNTAAEEHMKGDNRTVAQHAFDAHLQLDSPLEEMRVRAAARMAVDVNPQYKEMALDYLRRSPNSEGQRLAVLVENADLNGSASQRAAAVELITYHGDIDGASDRLLAIALDRKNRVEPGKGFDTGNWRDKLPGIKGRPANDNSLLADGGPTVADRAYTSYIMLKADPPDRMAYALALGLEKSQQRSLAAQYLLRSGDRRYQAYGNFLEAYDLPGHVNVMQRLIERGLRGDADGQQMVFQRILQLTDANPSQQLEFVARNLTEVPALRDMAFNKIESFLMRGATKGQRRQIAEGLDELSQRSNLPPETATRIEALTKRLGDDAKLEDAIMLMHRGQRERMLGVRELSTLHDQRAIKPLLEQAVSSNDVVAKAAIDALGQYNQALVKYYAQELKRQYFTNPVMTGKITDLMVSHRISPAS